MNDESAGARTWQILNLLADGKYHSGERLAEQMGISRASIFNAIERITNTGVEIQRIRGKGYRLSSAWERFDPEVLSRLLEGATAEFEIEIMQQATSSNTLLMQRAIKNAKSGSVLAVEMQTAGKGRLGRPWLSSLGAGLTFSLLWRFESGLNTLSGLSLAVGVAIVRALKKLGVKGVGLKWPNDIMTEQGKLGGVLIEAQGDMLGPSAAVIGIGLNYKLPIRIANQIDQPTSSLEETCKELPSRNKVLALILQELAGVLREFSKTGFQTFREEWEQYHMFQDRAIRLHMPDSTELSGIARGVTAMGELSLETPEGIRNFNSGEVGENR